MSVKLPIFQSKPSVQEIKSSDYYDNTSDVNTGFIAQASDGDIYVARLTNVQEWIDIFGGTTSALNYQYNNCYVLYEKEASNKTRWAYNQSNDYVTTHNPWTTTRVTYKGNSYLFAPPWSGYNDVSQFSATGCWANCPVYSSAAAFFWEEYSVPYDPTITYRLTNATTTGPSEAAIGDTVIVPLTFPEGYGVVNPSTDAYVTCNGVLVPSTYSNGQLVFTMPDPL